MVTPSTTRKLLLHPELSLVTPDVLGELGLSLSPQSRNDIQVTLETYSKGVARKNRDFKFLAGFRDERLFELRWELQLGADFRPLRLIGAELSDLASLLLLWHLKDPSLPSETQRQLMNQACVKAVERKNSIDTHKS